ncbi:MAG: hypothetical protein JSV30_06525 [Candidatus Omnitrophota bacterium]|nr:MAG: hypothetical protein JSV30_06525 [Candidatus Omnitrophota bacterium]
MRFPRSTRKFDEIFKKAHCPAPSELKGEYFVDMLSALPTLRGFFHRKVFIPEGDGVSGYNLLFADKKWGAFFLEKGICNELGSIEAMVINYDREENSFLTNKIRDYIRCIEPGRLYIGRFNYLFMGKLRFLGYFSLSKA